MALGIVRAPIIVEKFLLRILENGNMASAREKGFCVMIKKGCHTMTAIGWIIIDTGLE